ncbi:MAG TPA: hypothetical protein GX736_01510 [Mogibacterium sp.]|nr:hypothetical protein [Mogibacterium sp.]
MKKEIVILTLLAKQGENCVIAYDLEEKKLIRLVSNTDGSPVPNAIAESVKLLDIVEVDIKETCPLEHQTENVLIDPEFGFRKTDALSNINQLPLEENRGPDIFGDTHYKLTDVSHLNHSLELITFKNLSLYIEKSFYHNQLKSKADFTHDGKLYEKYFVTDPNFLYNSGIVSSGCAIVSLPLSNDFTSEHGYFKFLAGIYHY